MFGWWYELNWLARMARELRLLAQWWLLPLICELVAQSVGLCEPLLILKRTQCGFVHHKTCTLGAQDGGSWTQEGIVAHDNNTVPGPVPFWLYASHEWQGQQAQGRFLHTHVRH